MDVITLEFLVAGLLAFIAIFPIPAKNLLIALVKRKDYVVCHIYRSATRKPVIVFAIPDGRSAFQTRVWKKKTYNLNPEHSAYTANGRLHFFLLEDSNMPLLFQKIDNSMVLEDNNIVQYKLKPWDNNDILIFADEVDTGINAKSHNILHGDQSHIALILALIAVVVAVATAWYSYQQISDMSPMVHAIYQKITPANITVVT